MADFNDLRHLLSYDPSTGVFVWIARASCRMAFDKIGSRAGAVRGNNGYRYIKFRCKYYREHRLAYQFTVGPIPGGMEIDHVNGDVTDNRLANLRLATHQQNLANCKNRKNNTSGKKGVHRHSDGRWRAKISVSGKTIHLGLFETTDAAHDAYVRAANKYFGDFARAS